MEDRHERGPAERARERAQRNRGAGNGGTAPLAVAVATLLAYDLWRGASGWTPLHVAALAAAGGGAVVLWRRLRRERRRNARLRAELAATVTDADERQQAVSALFVNLARRNQSLLDRQLTLIGELEQKERAPSALAELFQLDHLATRIRRNAESLLVLSGDEPARRWGRPVPLSEVVRAAAAEVEDYRRVDVRVGDDHELAGRAVADVAHLLAELIENATTYSPTHQQVVVRSYLTPGVAVAVEDRGIGMTEADLAAANQVLAEPMVIDLRGRTMGLQVVSRLAHRYGVAVALGPTPGGGLTALVTLPADLVTRAEPAALPHRPLHLVAGTGAATATGAGAGADADVAGRLPRRHSPTAPRHLAAPAPGGKGLGSAGAAALGAGHRAPTRRPGGSREHARSMLSRFQASQRAGRALVEAAAGSLAPARPRLVSLAEEDDA